MTVSKARTLGSGCGMSMYSKATEIHTEVHDIRLLHRDPGYWTVRRKFELRAVLQA